MKNKLKYLFIASVAMLFIFSKSAMADDPENLKDVMQTLSADMQFVLKGILDEDFSLIAKKAEAVAYHDEPPLTHRLRILAELKTELPSFKKHDDNVHIASVAMKESAEKKDMTGVLESYSKTVAACVACHENYRERIRALNIE